MGEGLEEVDEVGVVRQDSLISHLVCRAHLRAPPLCLFAHQELLLTHWVLQEVCQGVE